MPVGKKRETKKTPVRSALWRDDNTSPSNAGFQLAVVMGTARSFFSNLICWRSQRHKQTWQISQNLRTENRNCLKVVGFFFVTSVNWPFKSPPVRHLQTPEHSHLSIQTLLHRLLWRANLFSCCCFFFKFSFSKEWNFQKLRGYSRGFVSVRLRFNRVLL